MALALVLAVKGRVPAGYMPVASAQSICDGHGDSTHVSIPVAGRQGDDEAGKKRAALAAQCPFNALTLPGLFPANAPQPHPFLEFAGAPALPATPRRLPTRAGFLLPPSRGPPALS